MAARRMWSAGAGAGGSGAGGGGASSSSETAEDVAAANEKALLHLSEQQAAAAAAHSLFGRMPGVAAGAGSGGGSSGAPPVTPATAPFSALGYRQSIAYSLSSTPAAATPLYSPEEWSRHLPTLSTHSLSFSTPPGVPSASSPSAQALADFHFTGSGSGGVAGTAAGGAGQAGQWQPQPSAAPPYALPLAPSSSTSPAFVLSPAAPRGALPHPHSSQSSPYSASPSMLSPSSSSVSRDEDIWAMEVANINRQAAMQLYVKQQQQQQQLQEQERAATTSPFLDPSVSAATSSFPTASPLGPPSSRASSAQSKLLSLLSRTEDEALKRQQQQYQQARHYQQQQQKQHSPGQQQMEQPPHQQSSAAPSQPMPSQHYQPRRGSDRVGQYSESEQQVGSMRVAAGRRPIPSSMALQFDAPPPPQTRSSSTPQPGRGEMSAGGSTPAAEPAVLSYAKKPLTARSPSPRSISASQPFQPRESFSGFSSFPPLAFPTQPIEQQQQQTSHLYTAHDELLLQQQQQQQQQSTLPPSAPLSPTPAEVAAAASRYLISETEPSTAEHSPLSSFMSSARQQLQQQQHQQQAAAHSFDWPPSQLQQPVAIEQTGYPSHGLSQVQSVTVHHILADQAEQQHREPPLPFPSAVQPLLATAAGQPLPPHSVSRRSPSPHATLLSPSQLVLPHAPYSPSINPLAPPHSIFSVTSASSAASSASSSSLLPFGAMQELSAAGVAPPSQPQPTFDAAVLPIGGGGQSSSETAVGSFYRDMALHQQHQQQLQHSSVASAELPFISPSRLPWLSAAPFGQSDLSSELSALRHRSFIAVGLASEAEARVKAEEDDAEMERMMSQQMQQQQQQEQPSQVQSQTTVKMEPGTYPVYHTAGLSASGEQQYQQQQQQHHQQHHHQQQQQQRYYVPAPSPTLGVPSDLPHSTPVFSSSVSDVARFSSSVPPSEPHAAQGGEQAAVHYAGMQSDAALLSYQLSRVSGPIPTFSSSLSSDRMLPSHPSSFVSQATALRPPSSKRRATGAVSSAELWLCPFNCSKVT